MHAKILSSTLCEKIDKYISTLRVLARDLIDNLLKLLSFPMHVK